MPNLNSLFSSIYMMQYIKFDNIQGHLKGTFMSLRLKKEDVSNRLQKYKIVSFSQSVVHEVQCDHVEPKHVQQPHTELVWFTLIWK